MPRRNRPRDGIEYELLDMSHNDASGVDGPSATDKSAADVSHDASSKAEASSLRGVDDVAAIPKGTIDPVYEAKARVLNHAVGHTAAHVLWVTLTLCRFKKLGWGSTTGNCSSL